MRAYDRTYGVEIEAIAPVGFTRYQLAEALTAAGVSAYDAGYSHAISSKWKIVSDNSLTEGRTARAWNWFPRRSAARPVSPSSALFATCCAPRASWSTRVAASMSTLTCATLLRSICPRCRRLAMLYVESEHILDSVMSPSRRGNANAYARSLPAQQCHGQSGDGGRRHGYRPHSLRRHGEPFRRRAVAAAAVQQHASSEVHQAQLCHVVDLRHSRIPPSCGHHRSQQNQQLGIGVPAHGRLCRPRRDHRGSDRFGAAHLCFGAARHQAGASLRHAACAPKV